MTHITLCLENPAQEQKLREFIAEQGIEIVPTAESFYESLQQSVKEYKQYQKGALKPKNMQDFLTELRNA